MMAAFALDTPDLDRAHALVAGYVGPFGLTPCRRAGYRARVRGGRIGALGVAEVSYRGPVDIASAAPRDAFILEVPVAGRCRASGSSGSREAGCGDILAHRPGQIVLTRMEDESRLLVFRLPVAALETGLGGVASGRAPPVLPPLTPERLASLERVARLFFDECAADGMLLRDDVVAAELQRLLVSLLGLAGAGPPVRRMWEAEPGTLLPASVRRAQALMIAAPSRGLSVLQLARHCGISVRTLQDNFRHFTGESPSEWWRGYRLDRVRAALRAGDPDTSVTAVAMDFGFVHLGRFAEQYRARFGEPPRETLRTARAARSA